MSIFAHSILQWVKRHSHCVLLPALHTNIHKSVHDSAIFFLFYFFSGWLSSLTSGSLFFFFFYYNISPPAPSPVSSITVTTPPEVHASKGDTVTLSCSFTSTSRPTSRMTVDWSYRPQSGGPPMMVSILLSKLTSRLCCSQCCKIMCVLYLQP